MSASLAHPKYRPDIDGLRAVAVLSVVAFHALPDSLKGGFAGVDVFFVISGFLISTIIFENLARDAFSFSEFYARRIRRIFPALIMVLAASYAFGWFALLADEYKQLGKHIAAGAGFVSNFAFWSEAGYFDNSADTKPLLHLWSLGIEEQFYIVWPLLLWLAYRRGLSLIALTGLIALVSFGLNLRGIRDEDTAAIFYSPQTRFWELSCGSLLAWIAVNRADACAGIQARLDGWLAEVVAGQPWKADGRVLSNILSLGGLLLLGFGFWRIDRSVSFPGLWAVVPVLGAVSVIAAGPEAWGNRVVLSNRIAVWFGLISYPLYLWHWPLLSFARIVEGQAPDRSIRIAAAIVSVGLAWLTYRLIERPVRNGGRSAINVATLALLMFAIGAVGYGTYRGDGLAFRQHATLKGYNGDISHLEYHKYIAEKYFVCTPDAIAREALRWDGFIRCMQSKPGPDVDIVLLGDSHAEHLFIGVADALPAKNVAFYIKGAPAFLESPHYRTIFQTILASKTIKRVILTTAWAERLPEIPAHMDPEREMLKMIDALNSAGKAVYLTDDVPAFPFSPDICKGTRWPINKGLICEMDIGEFRRQSEMYAGLLDRVVQERPKVKLIAIGKYLCGRTVCSMTKGQDILYRDNNHLNIIGSEFVGRRLVEDNPGLFD